MAFLELWFPERDIHKSEHFLVFSCPVFSDILALTLPSTVLSALESVKLQVILGEKANSAQSGENFDN